MKPRAHWVALAVLLAAGCGRAPQQRAARGEGTEVPVTVLADSAESGGLPPARLGPAAVARLTLVRVAPTRTEVRAPLPEPEPSAPAAAAGAQEHAGEGLAADDELRPPLPRSAAALRLHAPGRGYVELDVRVDESGEVTDALPAGGDADSATVHAAIDAALGQRWYPATRGGRPVAVWCRQRYEVGPGR